MITRSHYAEQNRKRVQEATKKMIKNADKTSRFKGLRDEAMAQDAEFDSRVKAKESEQYQKALEARIAGLEARLLAEESRVTGIDYLARDWARASIVREMKNRLADEAERNYESYVNISTRDGWYDPLNNMEGVNELDSQNIIHQIQNGDGVIIPDLGVVGGLVGATHRPAFNRIVSDGSYLKVSYCSDVETDTLYHLKNGNGAGTTMTLNHLVVIRSGILQETIILPFSVEHSEGTVMCYVPAQKSLYFYVHRYNSTVTGFWRYDLTTRTAVNLLPAMTGTKPSTRFPAMAYHKTRRKIMFWGGITSTNLRSTVMLEYDIDTNHSTNVSSGVTQPTTVGRHQGSMLYLDHLDQLILFGGTFDGANQAILDSKITSRWNPTTSRWEPISTTTTPLATRLHSLAYLKDFGMLIYGGTSSSGSDYAQPPAQDALWLFDGIDWKKITLSEVTSDTYQKQLFGAIMGIQRVGDDYQLCIGKGRDAGYQSPPVRDLFFIRLDIVSAEYRVVFEVFEHSTTMTELLFTSQYLGIIDFFVSVDDGVTYLPIQVDTPFSFSEGFSGKRLIVKAVLTPNSILAGAAVAVV